MKNKRTLLRNKEIIDRLNEIYKNKNNLPCLSLDAKDKYIIFSDLHFGDGEGADNFARNEETFMTALTYYRHHDFKVILLGDIEEFWQFDLNDIVDRYHDTTYSLLSNYGKDKVYRIFGNHDSEWRGLKDPLKGRGYKPGGAPEALMIGDDIFLLHGHQGDVLAEKRAWMSRFWARLFRLIEPLVREFGYENYAATKSQVPKDRERILYKWAKEKKIILICGHTHRAMFASRSYYRWLRRQVKNVELELEDENLQPDKEEELEILLKRYKHEARAERKRRRDIDNLDENQEPIPCYFNTGSGLFRNGITCIELEPKKIRLVKWSNDKTLPTSNRKIQFWNDDNLIEFLDRIKNGEN